MEKWRDAFRSQTSAGQSLTCSNCGSWDYLFQFKTAAVLIKLGNHHAAPTRFQHFRSMFSWILSSNMEPSPSLSVPPRSTGHLTLFCWNGTPLAAPNAHFSIASAIFFFFFLSWKLQAMEYPRCEGHTRLSLTSQMGEPGEEPLCTAPALYSFQELITNNWRHKTSGRTGIQPGTAQEILRSHLLMYAWGLRNMGTYTPWFFGTW